MSTEPLYAGPGDRPRAPDPDRLAGWWRRVAATLIDWLLLAVVGGVALALTTDGFGPLELLILFVFVGPTLTTLYVPFLMMRRGPRNGQSLGKQLLAIRVVRGTERPVGLGSAFVREFLAKGLLGQIPFYSLVDFLFPLGDTNRQALHDKLATTYVVRG